MLLYVAIICEFIGCNVFWSFGYLVTLSLGLLLPQSGFLGVQPISGVCKERVTLCSGFSGEKRPEWVIRAKP